MASDPDRDQVYVVSLENNAVIATLPMEPQDEPGRVAFDDAGRVHVALRRGNKVVSIDLSTATVLGRYKACASPRGIDYDPRGLSSSEVQQLTRYFVGKIC